MKHSIATLAFVVSVVMALISVGFIGGMASLFVAFYYEKSDALGKVPGSYWPIVWTVAGIVALAAGIHSFRATLRFYQNKKAGEG